MAVAVAVARIDTDPSAVNLTALDPRFSSTCLNRVGSPERTSGTSGPQETSRSTPRARALAARTPPTSARTSRTSKSTCSTSRCPASILEKSRMSLIRSSSERLETAIPETRCRWRSESGVTPSSSLRPTMPLSGVRISWLIVARKSDLCCEAVIARSRASASRRRARSRSATREISRADCSAICSMSAWRWSGGSDVRVSTATTSPSSRTGNAMVSRSTSSHTGPPLRRHRRAVSSSLAATSPASASEAGCSSARCGTRPSPPGPGTKARARSQSSCSTTRSRASSSTSSSVPASLAAEATACIREFCVARSWSRSSAARDRVTSW